MKPLSSLQKDIASAVDKLKQYVDKGVKDFAVEKQEPTLCEYIPKFAKPLKPMKAYKGKFIAVDCSTKPLMRANRFGVYLLRVAYASVNSNTEKNPAEWGPCPPKERISTAIGDDFSRGRQLERFRFEYESKQAEILLDEIVPSVDYLILDGASYFGKPKDRRFADSLYRRAKEKNLNFITISKVSPSLLDSRGRDLITSIAVEISTAAPWLYHPIEGLKADYHNHRFGDVSLIRLNARSLNVFRCDIMDYLISSDLVELLSPLTSICDDPRCLGYPICLYLAHDFAKVSAHAKLLHYRTLIEQTLDDAGLLDRILLEERLSNFRSELYGLKYPWELEERQIV